MYEAIRRGEPPAIAGDGKEVHDYIHVADVASGCVAAMLNGSGGNVLNLVTGVDSTLTEVAHTLLEVCGVTGIEPVYREDVRKIKTAGGDHLGFSPAKAKEKISWSAQVNLREGLRRYVAWRDGAAA
jgi:UDP-glucose 4-epimerase